MSDIPIIWDESVTDFSKWTDDFKRPDLPPGAAWWGRNEDGAIRRISYICPCGCSDWRQISVWRGEKVPSNWQWDGDEVAPTLSPSILHMPNSAARCSWHGFLIAGVWKTCP